MRVLKVVAGVLVGAALALGGYGAAVRQYGDDSAPTGCREALLAADEAVLMTSVAAMRGTSQELWGEAGALSGVYLFGSDREACSWIED